MLNFFSQVDRNYQKWFTFLWAAIVVVVVSSSSVSARRCTTVLSKNKVQEVVKKDPCIQKYTARCGWLSLEYCSFYHHTHCDKLVNRTVTLYYIVTNCCVGFLQLENGSCIEKVPGVSYKGVVDNGVQQNSRGNPLMSENGVYVQPKYSSSEPSHLNLSHGGYAGILCGFAFVASVVTFIVVAVRKRIKREKQAKPKSPIHNEGQGQELKPMLKSESPRTPPSPTFRKQSPSNPPSESLKSSPLADNSKIGTPVRPNQLSFTTEVNRQDDASLFSTPKQSLSHSPQAQDNSIDLEVDDISIGQSPPSSPQDQCRIDLSAHDLGQSDSEGEAFHIADSVPNIVTPTKVRQIAINNSEHESLLLATPTDITCSIEDETETEVFEETVLINEQSNQEAAVDVDESPLISPAVEFKPSDESPLISPAVEFKPSDEGTNLDEVVESKV